MTTLKTLIGLTFFVHQVFAVGSLRCGTLTDSLDGGQAATMANISQGKTQTWGETGHQVVWLMFSSGSQPTHLEIKNFLEACDGINKPIGEYEFVQYDQSVSTSCPGGVRYRCKASQCTAAFGNNEDICVTTYNGTTGSDPSKTVICYGTESNHRCDYS
ncbi:hypothetical protein BGW42_000175 [Actinomortierella wolfii]|nr:hypothetical protein BGW42_000175 [Actinomortierella wolfii]